MHVHRLGNAQSVRMGFPYCRGRTYWDRSLGYAERVIQKGWRRFSLALMSVSVFLFLLLLIFAKFA